MGLGSPVSETIGAKVDLAFKHQENTIPGFGYDMAGPLCGNTSRIGQSIMIQPGDQRTGYHSIGWGVKELKDIMASSFSPRRVIDSGMPHK